MWCGIVCVFVEKLKRLKICVDGVRERKTKNLWCFCGLNTVACCGERAFVLFSTLSQV